MSIESLQVALKGIVGAGGWVTEPQDLEPHLTEWRDAVRGKTAIMVSPATTAEVAAVVTACGDAGIAVVPQGGNTGLCGGAIPDMSGEQVIVNLSRMNRIRAADARDFSLVAEAGCILANVQRAAEDIDRYFPLSLGAEGSCEIGGNLSTNAGGLNVIRYGTARGLVLGLEVVLADGRIWNGLKTLRKNTAGYDLKQLFIGSEGTLGIITAAALKLFPKPEQSSCALLAFEQAADAVTILGSLRGKLGEQIDAFELISARALELVERHIPDSRVPFATTHPWYVLVEVSGDGAPDRLESALTGSVEAGVIRDAVIAKNGDEAARLWRLRHSISEAQKLERTSVKHDISVPIGQMQEFLTRCEMRLNETMPEAEPVIFGHVGDGNLHYNVMFPRETITADLSELTKRVTRLIYDLVAEMNGSFSAEHGVGQLKREHLLEYSEPLDIELMRTLKKALDPNNTLNPGKVI